jgi:hypothetical protein
MNKTVKISEAADHRAFSRTSNLIPRPPLFRVPEPVQKEKNGLFDRFHTGKEGKKVNGSKMVQVGQGEIRPLGPFYRNDIEYL